MIRTHLVPSILMPGVFAALGDRDLARRADTFAPVKAGQP